MNRPEDVRSQVPPGGWDRPVTGAPQITAPYAAWGSRVGAAIVDSIIVLIPATVLSAIIFGGVAAASGDDEGGFFAAVFAILAYLVLLAVALLVYAPLLMRRPGQNNGQTWGKQLFRIRVVRTNGVPMDFIWSGLREVVVKVLGVGIASTFIPLLPWLLDVLWPLWDDENRAVHDFIVETRVVQA